VQTAVLMDCRRFCGGD